MHDDDRDDGELLQIERRFCGPPGSGNGGYVAGRMAARLGRSATVRLRAPLPLEAPLRLANAGADHVLLRDEAGHVLAEGRRSTLAMDVPAAPRYEEVSALRRLGEPDPMFASCFVCGHGRGEGDGLRIFPRALAGGERAAAPWVPHASLAGRDGRVDEVFLWAALDCTGASVVEPRGGESAVLLGELQARLDGELRVGEPCVVLGWPLGGDGRKRYAGTALVGDDGRVVARARATWILVPKSAIPQ